MNSDIKNDLFEEKYNEYINEYIDNLIKNYPNIINENNIDGTKKDIYSLASERDIKIVQIQSDKNELDYEFSQNKITKEEYENKINDVNIKIKKMNKLYDELIFNIININDMNDIKDSILKYNLNNIDLDRLARAISSVSENKIDEFRENNKSFMLDKLSYWNYKYNKISKGISKARELEEFILNLIEK